MSEKVYAILLRLYPARFRSVYGEEALQLLRDRLRDERGFLLRLRLWFDLLGDLVLSLPVAHRSEAAPVIASRGERSWDGTPAFRTLEDGSMSPRALLYGSVASVVVYACILILVGRGERFLHTFAPETQQGSRSSDTLPKRIPDIELSYSPQAPASGSVVHLTVRVSALGGADPTGRVRFFDGVTVLSEGELEDGRTSVTSRMPVSAKHLLRATYMGDSRYTPASSVHR